jgi:predicted molibdopterin-dependent oxidoreductase YjgC
MEIGGTMSIRIEGSVDRGSAVEIMVDGRAVEAFLGESVAAALYAAGVRELRKSPTAGAPRGMFCLMGVCQECVVRIDGRLVPACQESVRAGMTIELGGSLA